MSSNKKSDSSRIGRRIAQLRELRGLTQSQLGEAVGVHEVTVSRWEGGKQQIAGRYLERVAKALKVPFEMLFQDSEKVGPEFLRRITPEEAKNMDWAPAGITLPRNQAHELIGRVLMEGEAERPESIGLIRAVEIAANSDWAAEELRTVLRWIARQLRLQLADELEKESQGATTPEPAPPTVAEQDAIRRLGERDAVAEADRVDRTRKRPGKRAGGGGG